MRYAKLLTICGGLVLALCAAQSIAAQIKERALRDSFDRYLVADADPPLRLSDVRMTIATFAAVVDAKFDEEATAEFERVVVREWRAGDRATIAFIDGWTAHAARLAAFRKYAEVENYKQRLLPEVLADLKRENDDPKREIFRRAYRRVHGQNSLGDFAAEEKILKNGGTVKDLTGDWQLRAETGAQTVALTKFSFLANGRVIFSDIRSGRAGACFATETVQKQGTAAAAGTELTIELAANRRQRLDSCRPADARVETLPAESRRFSWLIRQDARERVLLCLTPTDKKAPEVCYERAN